MGRDLENLREWARVNRLKNIDKIRNRKKISYEKNKEKILAQQKAYYQANRAEILARECTKQKLQRASNSTDPTVLAARQSRKEELSVIRREQQKARMAEKYKDHISVVTKERVAEWNRRYYSKSGKKEAQRAYAKAYRQRPEVRERLRQQEKERRKTDPQFALRQGLRCRIRSALSDQGTYKKETTEELLGCSIQEFHQHLESQFLPGMTWGNRSEWHIDHIKPCAAFDLTNEEERKACFHYTNLRPLWKKDNLRKGAKWYATAPSAVL